MNRDNWHEGDFNLFWFNVESNVSQRIQSWRAAQLEPFSLEVK